MKRSPSSRRGRTSREVENLVQLAEGISQSGSKPEDYFWSKKLELEIESCFLEDNEMSLNAALDKLADRESRAHEELADAIEGCVEHEYLHENNNQTEVLLFAAPILAWSRQGLETKLISSNQLNEIKKALKTHVFTELSSVTLANFLYSPDQLPETFIDTRELRIAMTKCLPSKQFKVDQSKLKQTTKFLADQRYFLGVVSVPKNEPIFQWQEGLAGKEEVLASWKKVGGNLIAKLMPQSAFELVLPRAYYVACRDADRSSRQFSIEASVAYLSSTLEISTESLVAIVGGCYSRHLEEYRIGFTIKNNENVFHGVVWPLLGPEDELSDVVEEVEECLKNCGISHFITLDQRLPMEYCDDCGAPLYPNVDGDMTHAEFPVQDEGTSNNLH